MLTPLSARRRAGFTLIELLVVIAIIAILTAIIFPVFATVRENARQQSSIAALHQIQTGIAQFELDQHLPPPVLFGYALPTQGQFSYFSGARMDNALQLAEQQNAAGQYFPGLYPEYVNNPLTFTDGNNLTKDLSQYTDAPLSVNTVTLATNGQSATLTPTTTSASGASTYFYLADAFDISPQITGTNMISTASGATPANYLVRYQTNWTDISTTAQANYPHNYVRQLRWQNPPSDTYVTSTTYHVPYDNHVLVLWQSGDAKSIDASRFLTLNSGSVPDNQEFWQDSPTDPTNPGP